MSVITFSGVPGAIGPLKQSFASFASVVLRFTALFTAVQEMRGFRGEIVGGTMNRLQIQI
jgi:ABC-type transport system involved in cytochrome c biogenesis permease component